MKNSFLAFTTSMHLSTSSAVLGALTRMVADREHIASSMLASRDDLIDYYEHRDSSPLSCGWRHELLGSHLDALLEGQIGLTVVDGKIELL